MDLVFNLHKRRFGVHSSPFRDVREDLGVLLLPGVFIHPCRFLLLLENGAILPASLLFGYGLCKKLWGTPFTVDNCNGYWYITIIRYNYFFQQD